MKHFEELLSFIEEHSDWKELLMKKPYSMKSILDVPYNKNWFMINYNLFESDLSNPVVKQCRGTIVEVIETDGIRKARIICAPYLKFFNFGDENQDVIDWSTAKTRLKVDGQLIKMFKIDGVNYWCSNGSPRLETPLDYTTESIKCYRDLLFTSIAQEIPAGATYTEEQGTFHIENVDWIDRIPEGWTLMFELTSPMTNIIVLYDSIKLWFHGARDESGQEHDPEDVAEMFCIPYEIPEKYDFTSFEKAFEVINQWNGLENEGIVVCDAEFHRVKLKCDDYLKVKFIHDISSPKGIFNIIMSEQYDDLTAFPQILEKVEVQKQELMDFLQRLTVLYKEINEIRPRFPDQKSYALWVMAERKELSSFFFMAPKSTEKEFIDRVCADFSSENHGYDKYCALRDTILSASPK